MNSATEAVDAHDPALSWKKSSRSSYNNCCVELAMLPGQVAVRDSKDPGPRLVFPAPVFAEFLAGVKAHEFDRR